MKLLVRWLINAVSLWIVTNLNIGVWVPNFRYALIAALVIGLVNATLGIFLKIITFPLTILTFGIFLVIINAAMLKLAAALLYPEFHVRNWTCCTGWWAISAGIVSTNAMPAQSQKFQCRIDTGERESATFICIPFDVKKVFGKARVPVKLTINQFTYRTTICVMGGKYCVPLRKSNREGAGVKAGDIVQVTVAPDEELRIVKVPAN